MRADHPPVMKGPIREVVIGRNSGVWAAAVSDARVAERFRIAIGHSDVASFRFTGSDRIWIFSYSRSPRENARLLAALESAAVREVVYVSSATTIVTKTTNCYAYPRVKHLAELDARQKLDARILSLGLVVDHLDDLPAGSNAATLASRLNAFLLAPHWPADNGRRMNLFEIVYRPFSRRWEFWLYRVYGTLQWCLRGWPCLLRPVDAVLRAMGIRWYGYIVLSNRLWSTTIS